MSDCCSTSAVGIVTGVVIGAIAMEVLNKTNPELVEKIEGKVKEAANAVKDAFQGNPAVEEA
ncbi:MAG: hypothetical protein HQK84_08995 [Nitrospinae bacterium]|nr:hypothetical protein [Nitrospinota bacterium]